MELMIKAHGRLDTDSCFRTKKHAFQQRAAVSNSDTKPAAIVCSLASFQCFNSAAPWFCALTLRSARPPEIIIPTFRPSTAHFWSWIYESCFFFLSYFPRLPSRYQREGKISDPYKCSRKNWSRLGIIILGISNCFFFFFK